MLVCWSSISFWLNRATTTVASNPSSAPTTPPATVNNIRGAAVACSGSTARCTISVATRVRDCSTASARLWSSSWYCWIWVS
ncbi:MAG: hypothetical protein R2705_12465 [Ilumatobacteraceae bacterium]